MIGKEKMGITVHYRGVMKDLERVEEFEDRVIDLALEVGASAQLWRSASVDDASRVVRGLMLDLSPGQETTSLLLSPEGWLVPICDIEAAENKALDEAPSCFVKTQFGSAEGHVMLVELLAYLKQEFFPDLYVYDESGYWQDRDFSALVRKLAETHAILDVLAEGLRTTSLSAEAAEDPQIVAARVERIARQVHEALSRPPEHAPVHFEDDGPDWDDLDEAHWDASYKEKHRKQERLHRAIQEQLQDGIDHDEAFKNALRGEGIADLHGESHESGRADEFADFDDDSEEEAWRESLPPVTHDDGSLEYVEAPRHPLQQAAMNLYGRLHELLKDAGTERSSHVGTLMSGAGEIMGGLAQALPSRDTDFDGLQRGLALVQLKRACRGAAFAKGALYALHAEGLLKASHFDELQATLKNLESEIFEELSRIRAERER